MLNSNYMKEILSEISMLAIKIADVQYTEEQIKDNWIGFAPALPSQIELLERSLGLELPQDYKDFLLLTNGFSMINDATDPSFSHVEQVDYLINMEKELVDIWVQNGITETGEGLLRSILIGGFQEEQYFLLIPPYGAEGKWHYWKFANWIPGESPFESLEDYFLEVLRFLKEVSP